MSIIMLDKKLNVLLSQTDAQKCMAVYGTC